MLIAVVRFFAVLVSAAVFTVLPALVSAQDLPVPMPQPDLPAINTAPPPPVTNFAPPSDRSPLAAAQGGRIQLSAKLTADGPDITRGLVWRVFRPEADAEGKLPLVASHQGGTSAFTLEPGSYLVHAAFGRAGATKRIAVTRDAKTETVVLDAGGLELDATLAGGRRIPADKLKFSIYEGHGETDADRTLILPDVGPRKVVGLNAGIYHVVSTYGSVNAVIRSDIRVDAGKLTQATVEHHAAELTIKLVREAGGEAIADTSWSILSESGDPIREIAGPYASVVLAEGAYTFIAKNRDRTYQRDFTVEGGNNQEVEVLATEANSADTIEGAD